MYLRYLLVTQAAGTRQPGGLPASGAAPAALLHPPRHPRQPHQHPHLRPHDGSRGAPPQPPPCTVRLSQGGSSPYTSHL